jgi:hypothetical protein
VFGVSTLSTPRGVSPPTDEQVADRAGASGGRALTIAEFCDANRISRAMFYKLRAAGLAPRLMLIGSSVRISPESHRDWRLAREASA